MGVIFCSDLPLNSSTPASGWYTPEMILISVDLPQPFSPARQWISPGMIVRSTPLRAWTPAKDL